MVPDKSQEDVEKTILEVLEHESKSNEPSIPKGQDKPVLKEAEDEGDKINVDVGDVDEFDLEKESEVKVATEGRDTEDPVKGKQIYIEDLKFSQGPINLASLSPIQELKLVALAQAKVSEDREKSFIENSELVTLASDVLEKLIPSF